MTKLLIRHFSGLSAADRNLLAFWGPAPFLSDRLLRLSVASRVGRPSVDPYTGVTRSRILASEDGSHERYTVSRLTADRVAVTVDRSAVAAAGYDHDGVLPPTAASCR